MVLGKRNYLIIFEHFLILQEILYLIALSLTPLSPVDVDHFTVSCL